MSKVNNAEIGLKRFRFKMLFSLIFFIGMVVGINSRCHVVSAQEVITISSPEDMQKLQYSEAGDLFELTQNIDMTAYGYWESIDFSGTFDGNGYAIKNLTSTTGGLFNNIADNSYIHDIRLINVNISHKGADTQVGGLVNCIDNSKVERCYVSGTIFADTISYEDDRNYYDIDLIMRVGGIAGIARSSTINECINSANITGQAESARKGNVVTSVNSGGIVGITTSTSITNCINMGAVVANDTHHTTGGYSYNDVDNFRVGGIVGYFSGNISQCTNLNTTVSIYAQNIGRVKNTFFEGDIVGYVNDDGYISNSYYSELGVGYSNISFPSLTYAEANGRKSQFSGLDWSIWSINKGINNNAPLLNWYTKYYQLAKPTANMKSGTYSKAIRVTLKSSVSGAKIYYTLDGTTPTDKSNEYSGTITISKNITLKAVVYYGDYRNSKTATYKYVIKK